MRIAIDTNALYTGGGGGRYVQELLKALPTAAKGRHDFYESTCPVTNRTYWQPMRALKTAYRDLFWPKILAPRRLKAWGVELYHTTGVQLVDPPAGIKHVVTLNDVAVLRHPERFRPWLRRRSLGALKKLHLADRIICISHFTAAEAVALLDLPPRRLEVIHDACGLDAADERQPEFDVPPEFYLFVGSLEPGKNLALLRRAYGLANARGLTLPPLLIVGARWQGVEHEGMPHASWRFLGRIPDAHLIYLYRRALALVFPSKYEGFGLPVLEALTLDCPVICSPVASLPEVAGEAACFADLTPEAYCEALASLARNTGQRRDLIERGREQARRFSWATCAAETVRVYESAGT